ncbi:hypothetical protein Tco_0890868 [Tanacetum coccineum]|uniref:Reverse transcriptase RNase H-like domain-containing protein n=1 Tax=Tanacetum coccineum TaxID=301880 RepID=A0ABQ5C1A5_9ASTR
MQALADLVRALTNAYSVWKDARSSELTNCMTLETCRSFKSLKTNRSPESFDSRDTIELYLSGRCRSFLALEDDPTSSGRLLMEEDMIPSVANVREGDGEDVFGYRKTYSSQPGKTTSHLPSWVQMLERLAVYEPLRIFRSFFHVKSIVYTGHSCIKYLFAKMDAKAKESAVDILLHRNLILKFETKRKRAGDIDVCVSGKLLYAFSKLVNTWNPYWGSTMVPNTQPGNNFDSGFYWSHHLHKDAP